MQHKRERIPRARESWVWLGGTAMLGVLGAGVASAAVLLWENVDVRQLAPGFATVAGPLPAPDTTRPPAVEPRRFPVAVFTSARNRAYFPDARFYNRELRLWRDLIRQVGGEVRDVEDATGLASIQPGEVLVLPEAPCLSTAELVAIRAHLARGGSAISNWATGVRDDACQWRGWSTLRELTDADDVIELPPGEGRFLTVPAGVPLAQGFDPGTRIELLAEPSLALVMRGPRVYWSDWSLNPVGGSGAVRADAAGAVTRTREGGRTAWFAWRVGQGATPLDSTRVWRLAQNGVLWAAGVPSASVGAWPGGAQAAMVFIVDVEDRYETAADIARVFRQDSIPATYFVVTQLVAQDTVIRDALVSTGEVGSHTVDHRTMGGRTLQDQSLGLRRSMDDITAWTGRVPTGFRPPEESFDRNTLSAWARAGGTYVLARNENRSGSPEMHTTNRGPVVLIPRLFKDDYNVIVQDRAVRGERISDAFIEGADKMHAIGGVAVMAGHTQIVDTDRRRDAFRVVAQYGRQHGGWWFAQGQEVAEWWRRRNGLVVRFDRGASDSSARYADLVVSHPSDTVVRAWIDVQLPAGAAGLTPEVDGRAVDFARTEWGIRVPVDTLLPGQARRIRFIGSDTPPASR